MMWSVDIMTSGRPDELPGDGEPLGQKMKELRSEPEDGKERRAGGREGD